MRGKVKKNDPESKDARIHLLSSKDSGHYGERMLEWFVSTYGID
jgi:hypothetical protein